MNIAMDFGNHRWWQVLAVSSGFLIIAKSNDWQWWILVATTDSSS